MKYERIRYPDGQISAKITEFEIGDENLKEITISERINSYEDLMFVKSLTDIPFIKNKEKHLSIPCLFGQRSDRRFDASQSFDLKIIAEIINSCNFNSVAIFDPHSDVALALINNSYKQSSEFFVRRADVDILGKELIIPTFISPDAGAYKKVFEYGEKLNSPVISAVKHRSGEGKIHLEFTGSVKDKVCLIIDDLCDGGYTFIKLAEKLRENGATKVYLYISHGYFSKGFEVFNGLIDGIYCTNSVKDIENEMVTQFKII